MALIGSIEQFVIGDDFDEYLERMDQLFQINETEDNRKVALFLTLIGPDAYKRIKSVLLPDKPTSKAYKELVKAIKPHFAPTRNLIADRFKFYTCSQKQGQTVEDYIFNLKLLAANCEFKSFLSEALRDRLVSGVNNAQLQTKLMSTKDLTWDSAYEIAQSFELISREQRNMNSTLDIHKLHPKQVAASKGSPKCTKCTTKHAKGACPAQDWVCYSCGRKGHSSKACFFKQNKQKKYKNHMQKPHVNELKLGSLHWMDSCGKPAVRDVNIEGNVVNMEIDTGAAVSVMSKYDYLSLFPFLSISPENKLPPLQVVTGEEVQITGDICVTVEGCFKLPLYIIESKKNFKPLLGRNWLDKMVPNWREIFLENTWLNSITNEINCEANLFEQIKVSFPKLFEKSTDPIKDFKAQIVIDPNAKAKFCKPYTTPLSLRPQIEAELGRMCDEKIIEPIRYSRWAAPLVCVLKKNNTVRLCGNFKVTINPVIELNVYPFPLVDEILAGMSGYKIFCTVDLKHAYLQLRVEETSQDFLVINTHQGLYKFLRVPYGVSVAPMEFQKTMDTILKGLEGVEVYIDDILVAGRSTVECKNRLWNVLKRLEEYNVRVNWEKCKFFQSSLEYLGHNISENGISPSKSKSEAIMSAPQPQSKEQLQSYLGLINYYSKFLPNSADLLSPLYGLLHKNVQFMWDENCMKAFENSKLLLSNNSFLAYFNPKLPITITCDASPYGVGAILSVVESGVEKPCYMVSATLSAAEKNYSQLDREALAVVFAIKKFHKFVFGYSFIVYTDHKPLESLLGDQKALSNIVSIRFHRNLTAVIVCLLLLKSLETVRAIEDDIESNATSLSLSQIDESSMSPITIFSSSSSAIETTKTATPKSSVKFFQKSSPKKRRVEVDTIPIGQDADDWKCPNITNSRSLECGCDLPHTLRCNGDLHGLLVLSDSLRASPYTISLLDCSLRNVSFLSDARIFENISLHGLVISSGEIKRVHKSAFLGLKTPLQALGLPSNALLSVPWNAITHLTSLERLDLSNNKIKALGTTDFSSLQNLIYLELSNNQISSISLRSFTNTKRLQVLKLGGNRLGDFPSSLRSLSQCYNLRQLDLSSNSINGPLTASLIPALRNLESLNLDKNLIKSIQNKALKNLTRLSSLSVRHNQIDVLQDHAFYGLGSLEILDLSYNGIVAISSSSLQHLVRLKVLDITHNFLRALTSDLIAPLPSLNELRLSGNDISIVAKNAFDGAKELKSLSLQENPLSCDCTIQPFAEWLQVAKLPSQDLISPTCVTPPRLEGAPLIQVPIESLHCDMDNMEKDNANILEQLEVLSRDNNSTNIRDLSEKISLLEIHYSADYGLILQWILNLSQDGYMCDAIFVYKEENINEILIDKSPIHCESKIINGQNTVSVIVPESSILEIGESYRFCLVLVQEENPKSEVVIGCSNITKLQLSNPNPIHRRPIYASDISNIERVSTHSDEISGNDNERTLPVGRKYTVSEYPIDDNIRAYNFVDSLNKSFLPGLGLGILVTSIFVLIWGATRIRSNSRPSTPTATTCYAASERIAHLADPEHGARYLKLQATTSL